jgi:CheY-like chemotaxis protein
MKEGKFMKVLLAEDDPLSRHLLHQMLSNLGYEVTACEDGNAAWEAFTNQEFHLVVSDWLMPNLNGLELCKKIRTADKSYYSYFILQTSCTEKDSLMNAITSGVDDYLLKPYDVVKLQTKLQVAQKFFEIEAQTQASPELLEAIKKLL